MNKSIYMKFIKNEWNGILPIRCVDFKKIVFVKSKNGGLGGCVSTQLSAMLIIRRGKKGFPSLSGSAGLRDSFKRVAVAAG